MPLLCAATVLAPLGCSSRSTDGTKSPAPFPVTERTSGGCAAASLPIQLPPLDAIVDTALLTSLVKQQTDDMGTMTLAVVFGDDGARPITMVRESGFTDVAVDAVKQAVDSTLVIGHMAVGPWSVRLHITTGEHVSYRIQRSEYCPPVLNESSVVSQVRAEVVSAAELGRLLQEQREMQYRTQRMRQYQAKCLIAIDGHVTFIERVRSSGNSEDDRALERMLERATFRPATLDGVPVTGWWVGNPMPRIPAR